MNIIKSIKIYCRDQLIFSADTKDFVYVYFEFDDYSLYIHPLIYKYSKSVLSLSDEDVGVLIQFCTFYINDRKYDKLPIYEIACLYSNALTFGMKHNNRMLGIFGTINPVVVTAEKTTFTECDKHQGGLTRAFNEICDFGVVSTKGYDEPKFKSFYEIVSTYYKQLGRLPETMFMYSYENKTYYLVNWDKSLLPYIAKMHFLEK